MTEAIKKICIGLIYVGTGIVLIAPIFVDNGYFFPFISTRVFLFRPAVQILLLAYLLLNAISADYRPRVNSGTLSVGIFIVIAFVSSLLGSDFERSFWGDMERGEGLLLWLHLLALLIVLTGTFRDNKKIWLGFLDFSIIVCVILGFFGLAQALRLPFVLIGSGARVDATFGNAAFFATYLLFHLAFSVFLFGERRSLWARGWYAIAGLLFAYLIVATQTRGAVIGLVVGILFGSILYAIKRRKDQKVRRASLAVVALVFVSVLGLYFLRNSSFVQNSPFRRLTRISLSERTAETRLATWKAAFQGWQEKFVLGWGMENFQEVFNKNFPPIIYEDEGSQVWFDRAHNVILDRGTTTGILGLLAFLGIFLFPLYHFLRRTLREPQELWAAIIFSSFLIAYLVQNFFIFESINVYIILFFTLAFWSIYMKPISFSRLDSRKAWIATFIIYALLLTPIIWKVNIEPAMSNRAAAVALNSNPQDEDFFVIVERFKKAIQQDTYGKQEYHIQFIEFVDTQLANLGQVRPHVKPVLDYADSQVDSQIASGTTDAKFYLLAMRHYNFTHASDLATKQQRIEKALSYLPKLQELTPTRPHIYQEAGYSHIYLYRFYEEQGDTEKARANLHLAEEYFRKAIALQPKVVDSYINLIMLSLNSGETENALVVLADMDAQEISWQNLETLAKLLNLAKANQNFPIIAIFALEYTKINKDYIPAWIDLALAYAYMDDKVKAREIANHIKTFGSEYEAQADEFLANLEKNYYRDQTR
ncbi:MAG: O-antigen ligase family protein [bacterium]|nr:O-antigen ligase family protein [bacterium]